MVVTLLRRGALGIVFTLLLAAPAWAQSAIGVDPQCLAPAGDPAPGTAAWQQRDTINNSCATLRIRDQLESPAFGYANLTQGGALYVSQFQEQVSDGPNHVHGGLTTLVPGSQAADPFRTLDRWTAAGLGKVKRVAFTVTDGAQLRGHVFEPNGTPPASGWPGVVITDGSVQAYEQLYYWAAEDLVANGYQVMTYDVQGQGDSDLLPAKCPDTANPPCQGVPYQQNYNFFQGAEDSLNWFVSANNPFRADLNANKVGIAGHSLGAAAVSEVGQCDRRVRTIIAWDNLSKVTDCSGVTVPKQDQYKDGKPVHVPAMALTNDYGFWPQPATSPPDPHSKDAGYQQLVAAGLDSQIVAFRGATHLTYTYIPLVLPASELAERFASYYTLAWFDRYLKNKQSGFKRLTATKFDTSVDRSSIGAGTFDPTQAAANPTDPTAGNVPYKIAGIPVANAVSFYYESEYSLHDTGHHAATCVDMRAGCPAKAPATP